MIFHNAAVALQDRTCSPTGAAALRGGLPLGCPTTDAGDGVLVRCRKDCSESEGPLQPLHPTVPSPAVTQNGHV